MSECKSCEALKHVVAVEAKGRQDWLLAYTRVLIALGINDSKTVDEAVAAATKLRK